MPFPPFKKGQKIKVDIREALVDIVVKRDGMTDDDVINHILWALKESTNKYFEVKDVDVQKHYLEVKP